MMFIDQRQMAVTEAISWLKTPHHHQGRVKGAYDSANPGGVDCLQLFGMVFSNVGLIDPLPYIEYARDGHLHRSEELVLKWMEIYAHQIEEDLVLPADMVVYKYGRRYAHGAIVINPGLPRIIHAVSDDCVQYSRDDQVSSHGHRPSARMYWRLNNWRSG